MDNAVSPSPLIDFPPEVWASVVRLLPGEQLGRLKKTGATSFWRKLCQPGVVRRVELKDDFLRFSSWPSFVAEFPSLEELLIEKQWFPMALKLDNIPATVRKLSLTGFQPTLYNFFGRDGKPLNLSECLPHLESLDLRSVKMQFYSWMLHAPSSLTNLKIQLWDAQVPLPPSLIDFEASEIKITSLPSRFSMPPQLESIQTMTWNPSFSLVLPYLSSHFRRLTCPLHQLGPSVPFPIEKLPKSMTVLNFAFAFDFVKLPEYISLLPPNLTHFMAPAVLPSSLWSQLPSQLKKLRLHSTKASNVESTIISPLTGQAHQVQTLPFQWLPRSITDLSVSYSDGVERGLCTPPPPSPSAIGDYFPPHLTYLELCHNDISVAAADCLPASLTVLLVANLCERICEHLPRGLKKLSASTTLMSPNLIKFLPKSLTSLHLSAAEPKSRWYDQSTCTKLNAISELPEFVHHENFGTNIDWKGEFSLPPSLTRFGLSHCKNIGDTFFMNQKLPNLVSLDLPNADKITDAAFPFLSPGLRALELRGSDQITGKCFRFLPESLIKLDLRSSTSIFDSDIQYLPRGLTRAVLDAAIHLTDACVKDLPRHLSSLELKGNDKITTASLPNFPYPMRSTSQGWCSVAKWSLQANKIKDKIPFVPNRNAVRK